RSKSLGRALGPDAARLLPQALQQAGLQVTVQRSDWILKAGREPTIGLGRALIENWAGAALAVSTDAQADRVSRWRRERLTALASGEIGLGVGHVDVLALPLGHG